MKRVAIVSLHGSHGGGIESVVAWQVKMLNAAGCNVRVISALRSPRPGGRLAGLTRIINLLIFPWISSLVARAWAGRKGVVFSHGWSSVGFGCDVVFAHGCWRVISEMWGVQQTLYSRIVCFYERMAARFARRVVCVSERVMTDWMAHYKIARNKAEILHNACDTNIFTHVRNEKQVRLDDRFQVLFVGRLETWKGLDFLSKLWCEVRATTNSDIALTICTPTPPEELIAAHFEGATILSGLKSQALYRLYNSAHILILPSLYESFEMVTIEALCCGTPVMLNDTGTRPFLEQLQCPGLFKLRPDESPLKQIAEARVAFEQISRDDLAAWARSAFNPEGARRRLFELAGVQ